MAAADSEGMDAMVPTPPGPSRSAQPRPTLRVTSGQARAGFSTLGVQARAAGTQLPQARAFTAPMPQLRG